VLQERVGRARTWKTFAHLAGRSGAGDIATLPLGVYSVRIAEFSGRRLRAQSAYLLRVFGRVPLWTLIGGTPAGASVVMSGQTFVYHYIDSGIIPYVIKSVSSPCTSISFDVASYGARTWELTQQSAPAATVDDPDQTIVPLNADVSLGQAWTLSTTNGGSIFVDGYADCDSTEGVSAAGGMAV
jgi:hypothetical protein